MYCFPTDGILFNDVVLKPLLEIFRAAIKYYFNSAEQSKTQSLTFRLIAQMTHQSICRLISCRWTNCCHNNE